MTSFLGIYKKQKKNLVLYKTTRLESNVIEGQIYVSRQQFVNGIVLPLTTTDEEPRYFWRAKSVRDLYFTRNMYKVCHYECKLLGY